MLTLDVQAIRKSLSCQELNHVLHWLGRHMFNCSAFIAVGYLPSLLLKRQPQSSVQLTLLQRQEAQDLIIVVWRVPPGG